MVIFRSERWHKLRQRTRSLIATGILLGLTTLFTGCKPITEEPNHPPLPIEPLDNQAVIYYNRADGNYDGWGLHLWDAQGSSFTPNEYISNGGTEWSNPLLPSGFSDDYGAYYVIDFDDGNWTGFNFIMHREDDKDLGGQDHVFDRSVYGNDLFSFSGNGQLFADPITEAPVSINGASAIWIDQTTIAYDAQFQPTLYTSTNAAIEVDNDARKLVGGRAFSLTEATLTDAQKVKYPHIANRKAWTVSPAADMKILAKGQMIIGDSDGDNLKAATKTQIPGLLDDLYSDQALTENFFPEFSGDQVTLRVWAPTAQSVQLAVYEKDDGEFILDELVEMGFNPDSGSWFVTTDQIETGDYYRFKMRVYHPLNNQIEEYEVADPYSLNSSMGSTYSQLLDLNSSELKPANWDNETNHSVAKAEDISVYEIHIRDISNSDQTGNVINNGKYMAFTESDRESMSHLQNLRDAGLTHIHLLPTFDIASVNEDPSQRVDLQSTKTDLCLVNGQAPVCADTSIADSTTIEAMLAACDTTTGCAQELMKSVRGFDSFNWGYDPVLYTVPEGSYASDANDESRVLEFREMVQSLHDMGFSVVMDVVYNHTNASGLYDNSILDKVVPGYYHRLNETSGELERSTCCDNTATENLMMGKLMTDSLVVWARDYKIDGFRFDLMAHHTKANITEAYSAVEAAVDHYVYFYGEGWNFGEVQDNRRFEQASQVNMAGTGVGTFSDRIRDSLRGGGPFDGGDGLRRSQGFTTGLYTAPNELNSGTEDEKNQLLHETDLIRLSMAGNLKSFVMEVADGRVVTGDQVYYQGQVAAYTDDPQEVINYVSKHDNQTLWDNNQYKLPADLTMTDRVRAQNLALNTVLMAQGIPFLHMGSDLLRSKSMERDSYDSGDWYNRVDFSMAGNNWNVGLPRDNTDGANWDLIKSITANTLIDPQQSDIESAAANMREFLRIRSGSPLLRLGSLEDIQNRLDFRNTGINQIPGVIAMSIDDGVEAGADLDPNFDAVMVIINGRPEPVEGFAANLATGFEVHPVLIDGTDDDAVLSNAEVTVDGFTVPARSTVVFVKSQSGVQGAGLPVSYKELTPTDLVADVHLRGSLYGDGWPADDGNMFVKSGEGVYELEVELVTGDYEFKIASSDWSTHNWGASGQTIAVDSSLTLSAVDNGNISINVPEDGNYKFVLDVSNMNAPVLSYYQLAAGACTELETSVEAGPLDPTPLYVRGDLSGWNADEMYRLNYKGNNIYQAVFSFSGAMQFKIADNSPSWDTQFFVTSDGGNVGGISQDIDYRIDRGNAGTSNNSITLPAGTWSFKLTLDDPIVVEGEAGNFIIESCTAL